MGYLILRDYSQYIQGDYLRQLTQGDDTKRTQEENVSLQAIAQRLKQKYDLDSELTNTAPYIVAKTYAAAERIVVDVATGGFTIYSDARAYELGDLSIYSGIGYSCTEDIDTPEAFNPAKWVPIAPQYSIFYAAYPYNCTLSGEPNPTTLMSPYAPVFNYKSLYSRADVVFWKGYTYECNSPSTVLSHQAKLQFADYTNIPFNNVFPDDPVNNAQGQYWNNKTAYTTGAGTITGVLYDDTSTYGAGNTILGADGDILRCLEDIDTPEPFDPAKWATLWVRGDNRNQTIKDAMVRITTFKLSPLIAGKNVPAMWLEDYRSIMRELNEAAKGEITLTLPLKQPNNATRTYNGGNIKNQNNY